MTCLVASRKLKPLGVAHDNWMGGRRLLIVAQKSELLLIVVASFGQVTDGCLKAEYAMALAWFIFSSLVQSNYPNQEVWS